MVTKDFNRDQDFKNIKYENKKKNYTTLCVISTSKSTNSVLYTINIKTNTIFCCWKISLKILSLKVLKNQYLKWFVEQLIINIDTSKTNKSKKYHVNKLQEYFFIRVVYALKMIFFIFRGIVQQYSFVMIQSKHSTNFSFLRSFRKIINVQ